MVLAVPRKVTFYNRAYLLSFNHAGILIFESRYHFRMLALNFGSLRSIGMLVLGTAPFPRLLELFSSNTLLFIATSVLFLVWVRRFHHCDEEPTPNNGY